MSRAASGSVSFSAQCLRCETTAVTAAPFKHGAPAGNDQVVRDDDPPDQQAPAALRTTGSGRTLLSGCDADDCEEDEQAGDEPEEGG
jgi:hypothetical protein